VSFSYASATGGGGTAVLDGFELHLRPGETVALVGRTGSGKSTASRLLARFYDVTGGAVRVDGHDVRDVTLPSLRHHIGMVLDEPFLFSVSIHDNIAYGRPDASFDDIRAAAIAAGADEFVQALPEGYDTVVGERGFTLSGGQRQRLSIARTLLVNPPILVLDDATSAIDVQIEQQIHEALRELMTDRTTLIIAHRLSTISLADRVAVVEGGRIIAEGTHAELLATEPRYAEILAQSDADADLEGEVAVDLNAVASADVERSRVLDADIAEMQDND
jgi:ATP-binding cassette subfamily B protein